MENVEKLRAVAKFMTEDAPLVVHDSVEKVCTIGWPLVKAWHYGFITAEGITDAGWSYIGFVFQQCLEQGMEA